jgi:hypothetical protein
MKIAVVCLTVALVCANCWNAGNSGLENAERRTRIGKIMKHYYGGKYGFEASGPLTYAQLESRLREGYEKWREVRLRVYDHVEPFEDSDPGKALARFKGRHREGDELYFFTSDAESWGNLAGISGYVLIRKNRIVDMMVTGWN